LADAFAAFEALPYPLILLHEFGIPQGEDLDLVGVGSDRPLQLPPILGCLTRLVLELAPGRGSGLRPRR
jgi:hypothetical protein